ncbi:hypothetical protein Ciccas_014060 [Cichlidogyrus casuarinus]|uniref:Uncharacterized protein n=1 Tax=Cichlidogyrus casuarinus TaxID=1844966 RepID=A0ABD2PK60_9PLAT
MGRQKDGKINRDHRRITGYAHFRNTHLIHIPEAITLNEKIHLNDGVDIEENFELMQKVLRTPCKGMTLYERNNLMSM